MIRFAMPEAWLLLPLAVLVLRGRLWPRPFVGTVRVLFLIAAWIYGSQLPELPSAVLFVQLFWGIAAGLIANFTYLYSLKQLGHVISAAATALVPVLAALGGMVFLDEPITGFKWVGILLAALGVALAAGILSARVTSSRA